MNLCWVQQCWHGQAEWGMVAEEWKIHPSEPQVSEVHRHPHRQQRNSEGLETEGTKSWHIRVLWSMSFSFLEARECSCLTVGDCS